MKKSLVIVSLPFCLFLSIVGFSRTQVANQAVLLKPTTARRRNASFNLSSPEKTVRSFLTAVEESDWESAASCLWNVKAYPALRKYTLRDQKMVALYGKLQFLPPLSKIEVVKAGSETFVKVIFVSSENFPPGIAKSTLLMKSNGGQWFLNPRTWKELARRYQEDSAKGHKPATMPWLNYLESLADTISNPARFEEEIGKRFTRHFASVCRNSLHALTQAAIQFGENNGRLTFTNRTFRASLKVYAPNISTLQCPMVRKNERYCFNDSLTNIPFLKLSTRENLVMFYDGKNGRLDFRHDGIVFVGFTNGAVRGFSHNQAKKLQWKP